MVEFSTIEVAGNGRRALEIDLFQPSGANTGIAVILVHGGGWAGGHRSMCHGYARALAAAGIVGVCAEYRLLQEAPWPSQLEDVRDIVRWAKAESAALGIDPSKIALQGFSAGGHLALMVGGTQPGSPFADRIGGSVEGTGIAAVVAFFAPSRLDADAAALAMPPLSLLVRDGGLAAAADASPYNYVHPNFPSTFILGGINDILQPLDFGLEMLQALAKAGAEVEFHYFHSQTHEFSGMPGMIQGVMDEVVFFYRRTLLDRKVLADEARELNMFARVASREDLANLASGPT